MYVSDIREQDFPKKERRAQAPSFVKLARNYVLIALLVALFGAIYETASFGVYSWFMLYAWAVPMVLGAVPALMAATTSKTVKIHRSAVRFWNAGIATLTVGSLFTGVVQIYGTQSGWSWAYGIAGSVLLLIAVLCGFFK